MDLSLPDPKSPRFSPILSSQRFIVLHFTLRSVIHEFIFVRDLRSVSRFFCFVLFLYRNIQSFQNNLLKRLPLSIKLPLLPFQMSVIMYVWILFTCSLFQYLDRFACSFTSITLYWLLQTYRKSLRQVWSGLWLCFSPYDWKLAILGYLLLHITSK